MGEISSKAKIFINSRSAGNFQLKRVKSGDTKDNSKVETVTAAGVDEGAGHREKPGGHTITLEVFREDKPEVDYNKLKRLKERFEITLEDEDGTREQYQACRVSDVSRKFDDQGENMWSVVIEALRRRDLPSK